MYKVNLKYLRKRRIYYITPVILGIALFLPFYMVFFRGVVKRMFLDSEIVATNINGNCTAVNDKIRCAPIYYFSINGDPYVCKTIFSTEMNLDVFDRTVYYNSKRPSQCVTAYDASPPGIAYLLLLAPFFCLLIGLFILVIQYKKVRIVKYLCRHGKLVKGLPYTIEKTGIKVGNKEKMIPVARYTDESGVTYRLEGESRLGNMRAKTIDLLIDEENPRDYYYLEFNIREIKNEHKFKDMLK